MIYTVNGNERNNYIGCVGLKVVYSKYSVILLKAER